jgi:hypothetical protein
MAFETGVFEKRFDLRNVIDRRARLHGKQDDTDIKSQEPHATREFTGNARSLSKDLALTVVLRIKDDLQLGLGVRGDIQFR